MDNHKNLVIRKRKTVALTLEEAQKMGLRERSFSLWKPIENDVGNCFNVAHCMQLLDIQQDEKTPESRALGSVWNRIIRGGKYLEANEQILALIKFLNELRFLRVGSQYIAIMPREIPKESLSFEISLLIKFGINLARIKRFKISKPSWVDTYVRANKVLIKKLKDVHYHDSVSKQFKQYFKKNKGSRLVAITSGSLEIDECRIDQKTLDYLKLEIGRTVMITRDPIITVFGFTLKIVGVAYLGTIELRPETLRGLCGDTDGDNLAVTKSRDVVSPYDFLPEILDYYDMKIGDMIGKCSGITNTEILDSEKHQEWNKTLTLPQVKSKMTIQIMNLGHTKSATQRCGYWSIIIGQFISEHKVGLAKQLDMSVEKAMQQYRFLLFKMQQSLTDAKHNTGDASLSLQYRLTDIHLEFTSEAEILPFLTDEFIEELSIEEE